MAQIPILSKAQWRADLHYLVEQLTAHHLNLYHSITQAQFAATVAALDAAIPNLEDAAIVVELIRLIASIGDGHTSFRSWELFHLYPLDLFWFENELRVLRTTPPYARALGSQVVRIGDVALDEAKAAVNGLIPQGENEWFVRQRSPFFLTAAEILHQLGLAADASHCPYTFQDQHGDLFTLDFAPIVQTDPIEWLEASLAIPTYRQHPDQAFWFTRLTDPRTLYLCFRRYDSFAENAQRLLRSLKKSPTERLIIDMRQNGGGDFSKVRQYLLPAIKQHPDINQPGHLFVIIGRQTYSAAMSNATDFRKETHAFLVGEPTSARPNGYQENYRFVLPNSQLDVSCSTRFYQFQSEDTPAVFPDKWIEPTWEAYQAGRDPVMEWILAEMSRTQSQLDNPKNGAK